ncbi:aminopeptidase P family protein [Tomitella fengzijianii]|uniref:Aminopeptidase P family protein n=2 Tax=Tomitella fengzijianii TaxID=2597660 RepID=A0A516X812_9ACTN|nr:aminopeptidase P family protein [Tomitella fengzijianii]
MLVVTDLVNVRYLSGFTGSNAALLIVAADPLGGAAGADDQAGSNDSATVLATDGRYTEQAAQQAPGLRVLIDRDCAHAVIADHFARHTAAGPGRAPVGFEASAMSVADHAALDHRLTSAPASVELVPTTGVVEGARLVKDDGEIALIARACAVGDAALRDLLAEGALAPGRSERQVARRLEWLMFEHGAEAIAFETIIACGANSAIPHHRPTDDVLRHGNLVKMDFGAVVGGYNSDMTRTVVLGAADAFQRDTYELVRRAQEAGVAAVRAGVTGAEVDRAARAVIDEAGAGELFTHGLGHGVGLRVHEAPPVSSGATGTLPAGAVVTVEPGVYHAGRGGVRIEDTLVVRDGGAEILTRTGKDLRVV